MGRNNESASINYKDLVFEYLYTYYDKDLVDYIKNKLHIYPITVEEGIDLFCYYEKTKDGKLIGFNILVPKPYDLKSSQIFIHEYKHGMDMYPYLGKDVTSETELYEERAKNEEKIFEEYLVKRLSNKGH